MDSSIVPRKGSQSYTINFKDPECANSSVIGVLLLITIVMVMGGIVSLVLTSQPLPDKVPLAYLSVSQSHERVELFNKAGDTLTSSSIAIVVDGVDRTAEFRKPENTLDWGTLHAGEHIYYLSPQEPKSVQVVYVGNSGQYLLATSGSETGTPITIIASPTPVPTIPAAATPTVMQITPDSGYNNTTINTINVTGTAFVSGATVTLNGTGFADLPATNVTVVSPLQITCSFNLTGVPAGFRNVVVTNNKGSQGMLSGGFRIDNAGAGPIADFVATPAQGTIPLTVQFNATSPGSPVSWEWTFGDGGTSTIQNATHQYTSPGTFTVNLTAIHADGSYRTIKPDYITVSQKPQAIFTSNVTQIPVNGFVQFYDNSTNTPTQWQWTFGDDLFYDTHQNPIHQYINPGNFSVQLTVTNADGSDVEIKTQYIQVVRVNHPPVLTQIPSRTATAGVPLTFVITGSDPDNDHLTYSAVGLPVGATFNPSTRTFAWTPQDSDAGNYSSTFTVSDGVLTDSETSRITVTSQPKVPPKAQFSSDTTQGQSPLTVQFIDQSTGTPPMTYHWDFSDGSGNLPANSEQNPSWRFWEDDARSFTVTLTVTNAYGTDTIVKNNYITFGGIQTLKPVAAFTSSVRTGTTPLTVQFTDQSTGTAPLTYAWDFNNDGSTDSTVKSPSFTYTTVGTYAVKLTVTNANGTDSEIKTNYITIASSAITTLPTAQFTANTTQGTAPLTVQFTDLSVSAANTSYTWDINNDGVVDYTTRNTAHTYQTAGTYTVKLTVTNANGTDSEIKTGYISVSSLQSGDCYGAETCNPTGNPIGGGAGYTRIITETDSRVKYVVTTRDQLLTALKSAKAGEVVFVPSSATIDLTGASTVTIPAGVILASDRGYNGRAGGLIKRDNSGTIPLATFMAGGDNVRFTGLRIQGPHSGYGADYGDNVKCAIMEENKNGLEVDNCEIYYWSYAGVAFENTRNSAWSGNVHHNSIHHIAGEGYGYGVMVAYGDVLIEANNFDYTRHAVIGEGCPGEKFVYRYNYYGSHSLNPVLDLHTNCGGWSAGGVSGRLYDIHHNTIVYAGSVTLNAYGTPSEGLYITKNILATPVQALNGPTRIFMTDNRVAGKLVASGPVN